VEIPRELRDKITFYPVKHMDEVIELALGRHRKAGRRKGGARKKK